MRRSSEREREKKKKKKRGRGKFIMEEAKEKILEVKSSLETLLKCTDEVLSDVRKEGEREKWVQAVLAFCDKQKQAAQVVSSIDFEEPREKETPTKQ